MAAGDVKVSVAQEVKIDGMWLVTDKGRLAVVNQKDVPGMTPYVCVYPLEPGQTQPKGLPYAMRFDEKHGLTLQIPRNDAKTPYIVSMADVVRLIEAAVPVAAAVGPVAVEWPAGK